MDILKPLLMASALFGFACNAVADDNPTTVIETQHLSKEECINNSANDCIQSICETSSALDCTDKCKQDAVAKCEEQADE